MAAAISCMRGEPAGFLRIQTIDAQPYSRAMTAHTNANIRLSAICILQSLQASVGVATPAGAVVTTTYRPDFSLRPCAASDRAGDAQKNSGDPGSIVGSIYYGFIA